MIWLLLFINLLLLAAALYLLFVIARLFMNKEYRDCPPYLPSFGKEKRIIVSRVGEILKNSSKEMTILDPGCGTGTLLIGLAKKFPNHKFVGIEWGRPAYLAAKFNARNLKNVTVIQQDMFTYPFNEADIIVCFLMPPLMERLGNKIKTDGKKGLTIFSNSFEIPNMELNEKVETSRLFFIKDIYIYKL